VRLQSGSLRAWTSVPKALARWVILIIQSADRAAIATAPVNHEVWPSVHSLCQPQAAEPSYKLISVASVGVASVSLGLMANGKEIIRKTDRATTEIVKVA